MPFIEWNPTLSVGHAAIDAQHQKLCALANKLHDAMTAGKGKAILADIFTELVAYTKEHFSFEESIFMPSKYPNSWQHKEHHQALVQQVNELNKKLKETSATVTIETMMFLRDWVLKHIMEEDKGYSSYIH